MYKKIELETPHTINSEWILRGGAHSFKLHTVDDKAVREVGPDLIFALHADPLMPSAQASNQYKPHFDVKTTGRQCEVTANLRGGYLNRNA